MAATRIQTSKFLLGHPAILPENKLPTNIDVINHARFLRNTIMELGENNPPIESYIEKNNQDVLKVWNAASIPTIQEKTVRDRVKSCYINGMKIGDTPVSKRSEAIKENKLIWLNEMFDITSCRCINSDSCICPREFKVHEREWPFLIDQRGARQMLIGNIDPLVTRKMQRKKKSTLQHSILVEREEKRLKLMQVVDKEVVNLDDELAEDISQSTCDSSVMFHLKHDHSTSNIHQFPKTLTNTIKAADRYGISDRALADLLSNFLVDLEMITEADSSLVIDRSKIRRHRQRERHTVVRESKERNLRNIKSLYFDVRMDKNTKVNVNI